MITGRKGKSTLVWGAVSFALGVMAYPATIALVFFLGLSSDRPERYITAPGTIEVVADKAGKYRIWYHHRIFHEGTNYDSPETLPDGVKFSVTDASGRSLEVRADTAATLKVNQRESRTVAVFDVVTPGAHSLAVTGNAQPMVFSVRQDGSSMVLLVLFGGFLLAVILVITGLTLGIIGLVQYSRSGQVG